MKKGLTYFFYLVPFCFLTNVSFAQKRIKGYILNVADSLPVSGATVYIRSHNYRTTLPSNGQFILTIQDTLLPFQVTVSAVGYQTIDLSFSGLDSLINV